MLKWAHSFHCGVKSFEEGKFCLQLGVVIGFKCKLFEQGGKFTQSATEEEETGAFWFFFFDLPFDSQGSDVLPSEPKLRPRHTFASGVDTGEKFFQRAFNVEDLLVSAGEAQVDSKQSPNC